MKLNTCLSFKVNNILIKILKLKLNPFLIIYIKSFIIIIKVYKFNTIIFINKKLNFWLISYNT
jgi:hypothetical protein